MNHTNFINILLIGNILLILIPSGILLYYSIKSFFIANKILNGNLVTTVMPNLKIVEIFKNSEELKPYKNKSLFWLIVTLIVWIVGFLNFIFIGMNM